MDLLDRIKSNARKYNKKIVLPEGTEERTLKAADILLKEGIAQIILLGSPDEIRKEAGKHELSNIRQATIIDPLNHSARQRYIELMLDLRSHKGLTRKEAEI
jgi:phosphate acetyltransferase